MRARLIKQAVKGFDGEWLQDCRLWRAEKKRRTPVSGEWQNPKEQQDLSQSRMN